MNVTLVLKKVYRTGRESGERQKSACNFCGEPLIILLNYLSEEVNRYIIRQEG